MLNPQRVFVDWCIHKQHDGVEQTDQRGCLHIAAFEIDHGYKQRKKHDKRFDLVLGTEIGDNQDSVDMTCDNNREFREYRLPPVDRLQSQDQSKDDGVWYQYMGHEILSVGEFGSMAPHG
ncbi:hypothetical protein D3C80_1625440 [compost metagenome]